MPIGEIMVCVVLLTFAVRMEWHGGLIQRLALDAQLGSSWFKVQGPAP